MAAPSSPRAASDRAPRADATPAPLSIDPSDRLLPSDGAPPPKAFPALSRDPKREPRFYREVQAEPRPAVLPPPEPPTLRLDPPRAAPRHAEPVAGPEPRLSRPAPPPREGRLRPEPMPPGPSILATLRRRLMGSGGRGNGGSGGGSGRGGRRGGGGRWGRRLLIWGLTLAIWVGIGVGGVVAYYAVDLPDIDKMTATTRRPSVVFQSAEGEVFAAFGDLYGEPLTLPEISPYLVQAVLATEDRRFFSHFGIDLFGLARAFYTNLRAGHVVQGGSTITQQLAKNLFLTPDRTMKRKMQEVLMALWLERRFSKEQILALYLNRVYLGSGTFGVDAAARRYFDVSARKIGLYQAAVIAGLLKAPSRYSPINDPDASRRRTADVVQNMVEAGYIDQKTADAAEVTGAAELVHRAPAAGRYFADWMMSHLDQFGEVAGRDIVIQTTLDLGLQRKVEADLKALLAGPGAKANVSQGAVVVMTPDGAVRAMVGGREYDDSQFNRAAQGLRQPGSSFKPFVYLTAMERGYSPDDTIEDAPIKLGNWSPGNYTGRYLGTITLRQALAESVNTVAVRLVEAVGPNRVIATARRLGISSDLRKDATLALGTSEVTLLEMTNAYAAFANGGQGITAYGVAQITDPSGRVLYKRQGGGFGQVISPTALARMLDVMTAVIQNGSGKAARLDRPAAGKTGTTQDYRDAWFMGFTADYVAGVWLGNDDYRNEMKKVTGGGLPAQLWKQVMVAANQGLPPRPLTLPAMEPPVSGEAGASPAEESGGGLGDTIDDLLKGIFGR